MVGGEISWNEWDNDNLNYLVLKNIEFEGHTFSAGPYFGYFVANNIALGGRFSYKRYFMNLGQFDLNLGEDLNIRKITDMTDNCKPQNSKNDE